VLKVGMLLGAAALFTAGFLASLALAGGNSTLKVITTHGGPKPGALARSLAVTECVSIEQRVGKTRFVKTFATTAGCRAVLAATAQSAIGVCEKRYPPGSTAEDYCIEFDITESPVERAAVGGLRIKTGGSVTYIPVPTAGPGAGTGIGTGAGTGGGVPGSHG
jgi:hypothetical protein